MENVYRGCDIGKGADRLDPRGNLNGQLATASSNAKAPRIVVPRAPKLAKGNLNMNHFTPRAPYLTSGTIPTPDPLVNFADVDEFKSAVSEFKANRWHEDRWKTFRLRFGIYEQRQKGLHMIRLKVPGGRLSTDQARTIAKANADLAGGAIHITTRQAIQLYFIELDNLSPLIEQLNRGNVTTREASGGTFRNTTACAHSGFCPHEKINAKDTADNLARAWLRHPLVQHMPRKVKTAVSGCELDCGLTEIDDLGFIATDKNTSPGFRVVAGGGLGTHPRTALEIFDFISEHDLPIVQEAVARIHHRHSNRENKNRSRLKFLVDKFGAEKFVQIIRDEFEAIHELPTRPWQTLDGNAAESCARGVAKTLGPVLQPDGRTSVGIDVALGIVSPEQLIAIADLADHAGAIELGLTRNQNIIAIGLESGLVETFITGLRRLGLDASGREHAFEDLVACFGSSTCAIGITDANALASEILDVQGEFSGLPHLKIRISGCHNSCGHHHIADIGFHGIAKKIDGKPAPHYQLHLGGSPTQHAITGPFIPARLAKDVLRALLADYATAQQMSASAHETLSVRSWADALGKEGVRDVIQPVLEVSDWKKAELAFDLHDDQIFLPPETATGECAAGSVVAEHMSDLARVALENVRRAASINKWEDARAYASLAVALPARRLLIIAGENDSGGTNEVFATLRTILAPDQKLLGALDEAEGAQQAFSSQSSLEYLEATIGVWHVEADRAMEDILQGLPDLLAGAAQ